jgi:hypothetical protein
MYFRWLQIFFDSHFSLNQQHVEDVNCPLNKDLKYLTSCLHTYRWFTLFSTTVVDKGCSASHCSQIYYMKKLRQAGGSEVT